MKRLAASATGTAVFVGMLGSRSARAATAPKPKTLNSYVTDAYNGEIAAYAVDWSRIRRYSGTALSIPPCFEIVT
jgi:hypothetical protein